MTTPPALHIVPPPVEETKEERKRRVERESSRRYREAHAEQIRAAAVRYRAENPERWKEIKRRYNQTHPEVARAHRAKHPERYATQAWLTTLRGYGLTEADYEHLLILQNGVCAICRRAETVMLRGKLKRLSVDHCHDTGKVRGLLCALCNHALGQMHDDPARLRAAADYLERSR